MSLTLNMVGGGSGGGLTPTDAILRVIANAGSTVTITKDAITKTDQGHENADDPTLYDYYFFIHQSQFDAVDPWSVTATNSIDTVTKTIIINASNEYNIDLSMLVLFFNGDNTSVTGGYSAGYSSGNTPTRTYNATNIYMKGNGTGSGSSAVGSNGSIVTNNLINVSDYNTLKITLSSIDLTTHSSDIFRFGLTASKTTTLANYPVNASIPNGTTTAGTYSLDISASTGSYYVGFGAHGLRWEATITGLVLYH